jgi:hypothetical protein
MVAGELPMKGFSVWTRATREMIVAGVFVYGSLCALALESVPDMVFRARATELFTAAASMKLPILEHYALHGDWDISEGHFFGPAAVGVSNGVAYALGDAGRFRRSDALVFLRPAVFGTSATHPVVIWLCGGESMPAGWSGPPQVAGLSEPQSHSSALCQRPRS